LQWGVRCASGAEASRDVVRDEPRRDHCHNLSALRF
jgi:hypothetical protein